MKWRIDSLAVRGSVKTLKEKRNIMFRQNSLLSVNFSKKIVKTAYV